MQPQIHPSSLFALEDRPVPLRSEQERLRRASLVERQEPPRLSGGVPLELHAVLQQIRGAELPAAPLPAIQLEMSP